MLIEEIGLRYLYSPEYTTDSEVQSAITYDRLGRCFRFDVFMLVLPMF